MQDKLPPPDHAAAIEALGEAIKAAQGRFKTASTQADELYGRWKTQNDAAKAAEQSIESMEATLLRLIQEPQPKDAA